MRLGIVLSAFTPQPAPELPVWEGSETTSWTLSSGTPAASAAICAITVCAPWPTSAPA